jgi:2-succinyl-5-enolpyruvyl-6-hydroxy-3-cyclohexene-1-carboxylate synthase
VTVAATFAATLVDEWVRAGLRDVVVCPGSRSGPLVRACAARSELRCHVRLDERSAGFFALGLALASGRAAVVVTTSGTAAAELLPAVVEAHHAHVPLVVVTADRPPELHGVGAPQTVEQGGMFRAFTRLVAEPGVPDVAAQASWRSLAARLVAEAERSPLGPGPVHLNLPLREPLVGEPEELPPGRDRGEPWHGRAFADEASAPADGEDLVSLVAGWRESERGLLLAGGGAGPPESVRRLAQALGWPLLADPRSGARRPGSPGAPTVAAFDALAKAAAFAGTRAPDIVVRLGAPFASKAFESWLAEGPAVAAALVLADPGFAWRDPGRRAAVVVRAGTEALARAAEASGPPAPPSAWSLAWGRAEEAAQRAFDRVLAASSVASGPLVARRLPALVGDRGSIVASSSLPVRELEWYGPVLPAAPRTLANRGANGIDGVVSTVLGVAAGSAAGPVVGLLGDVAFLHDVSGLVWGVHEERPPAALVVVDNGGGAIFSLLPGADCPDPASYERFFLAPQAADPAGVAEAFGWRVLEAHDAAGCDEALAAAVESVGSGEGVVVVVRSTRRVELDLHRALDRAAAVAAEAAGGA